ncbi:MAG: DDE-type integrase/transposase/recombinase, partial [Candidatus Thiodiazotropha endolucinida]|nr:DDE-type integrase/transposase/recombinase [Candidatus Thiodiazotropha taylori]MCW4249599.1 RNase H-like domain-containing protein [Candidatus Thiodiazotropha endolucinida]
KTLDDILPDLTDAKVFSKFDARSGYWSIVLSSRASLLTTFQTPFGRYRFLRLPYGLRMAQDEFISKMEQCLEGLPGVKTIVDDIVVFGKDKATHDANIDRLMTRCREKGIKLNPDKTEVGRTEIPFFGHCLSAEGLKMDPQKVKALREMPAPTSRQELETVLGMITYLQKFAPNMAEMTSPLRQLLSGDVEFVWEKSQQDAFDKIKDVITREPGPVLAYFDPRKAITIQSDASKHGLGCVLLQDGKPVCFASKSLTPTEIGYAQIEKELYAVLFACKRFHQMVYSKHITVQTDHKPLVAISKKGLHSCPPRLQRMLLQLSKYDIEVTYERGKNLHLADTLSRKFLSDTYPEIAEGMDVQIHAVMSSIPISDQKMELIRKATENDIQMQELIRTVLDGWPDKYTDCPTHLQDFWNYRDEIAYYDGILLKGSKVIIPKDCRKQMLEKIHECHLGVEKCTQRARDVLFWPNMTSDIRATVLNCAVCLEHRNANQKEPLKSHNIPDRPWQVVATDLFYWNNTDYIVLVDLYSRFFEVSRLPDTRAQTVINKLKSYFSRHGISETIISDNAPQFSCALFADFCKDWDIEHSPSSPFYQQANPAERTIQTIKRLFNKALQDKKDPYLAILAYRSSPLACGKSPAQLLYSRQIRSTLPATSTQLDPSVSNKTSLKQKMTQAQVVSKQYYDRSAKEMKPLTLGEGVRIRNGKFWKPAVVKEKINDRSYVVETKDGGIYRRNRKHLLKSHEMPFQAIDLPSMTPNVVNTFSNPSFPTSIQTRNTDLKIVDGTDKNQTSQSTPVKKVPEPNMQSIPVNEQSNSNNTAPGKTMTRSGRIVKPPVKLDL